MLPIALVITGPYFPVAESVRLEMLNESPAAGVPVPLKLIHDLHKPCCKLVVVELPSPVTAIDPAVDVPVSVFVLSVAIVYLTTITERVCVSAFEVPLLP